MQMVKVAALLKELKYITGQFALFGCSKSLKRKVICRYNQLYAYFREQNAGETGIFFEAVTDNTGLDDLLIHISLLQKYLEESRVVR